MSSIWGTCQAGVNLSVCGHAHLGPKGLKRISNETSACNVGYSVNEKKMVWLDFFWDKSVRMYKKMN